MKRPFQKPLIGAGSLALTIIWSGMAFTGPPEATIAADPLVTGPAAESPPLCRSGVQERPQPLAPGDPHKSALLGINRELLAKASFPDNGPAEAARLIEPQWLGSRLQRREASEGAVGEAATGRPPFSEPLSLFLLGTGMFGLAAFKRKWSSR